MERLFLIERNRMNRKVLIVDDSESIRTYLKNEFEKNHFDVEEAINGNDGITKVIGNGPFDIIISDLNMPECDGIEFLKLVRKEVNSRFTPFIIVTTENQTEKKEVARLNGATGWIVKPFLIDNFIKVVKKIVQK